MIAIASMKKINIILILLLAFTSRAERLLLRGATVHTVSGQTLAPGDVLVDGKKIVEVASKIAPKDARVIDLKGQHVYPGLIAANTTLGLVEISGVAATRDTAEVGQFTPDVQSLIAVNPARRHRLRVGDAVGARDRD